MKHLSSFLHREVNKYPQRSVLAVSHRELLSDKAQRGTLVSSRQSIVCVSHADTLFFLRRIPGVSLSAMPDPFSSAGERKQPGPTLCPIPRAESALHFSLGTANSSSALLPLQQDVCCTAAQRRHASNAVLFRRRGTMSGRARSDCSTAPVFAAQLSRSPHVLADS